MPCARITLKLAAMANLLTISRILLIAPLALCFYVTSDTARWAAFILFALAAASDFLDGYIARKRGEISALGAALDPIADKLLTTAVALLLIADGTVSGLHILVVMVIVLREIWISGLREALAGTIALPVTRLAKWKTTVQFLAFGLLIMPPVNASRDGAVFFLWAAAALTVWTGARYTRAALRRLRDSGSPR